MGGFKLIAITPLKGCSTDFRKNLEIGKTYQFYNNYTIELDEQKSKIVSVKPQESTVPANLYTLKNGIELNVSAVVGKNGSGKSTIFELLFYLISIIATDKKNAPNTLHLYSQIIQKKIETLQQDYKILRATLDKEDFRKISLSEINLTHIKGLGYNTITSYLFMLLRKHDLKVDIKSSSSDIKNATDVLSEIAYQIAQNLLRIKEEEKNEKNIRESLNLSLIYEIKSDIFEIEYINGKFLYYEFKSDKVISHSSLEDFELSNFFYNVVINYSHHALNSKTIGNWINQLFHKNDGYITPLVINPMREEGNFNINHELKLSKERLMSNIIFNLINEKEFKLLGKYRISKFIFTPKILRVKPISYGDKLTKDSPLNSLLIENVETDTISEHIDYWDFAIGYLEHKIRKIGENYSFLVYSNKMSNDPLLDFIKNDKSHITKKIRQTLNFLKSTLAPENRRFWKTPERTVQIELSPNDLIDWLSTFHIPLKEMKPVDLIEYALPGFFNIDFELQADSSDKPILFGMLSSGEQQMVFNVNSILYHLYNLQSIHTRKNGGKKENAVDRIRYKNVNIVLDEIELYYHPEMQRQLVKNIIESFENIKRKDEEGIEAINLCFLTHSPFILSDIPGENVLLLEDKSTSHEIISETFATNVHDLLANDFFMKDGFMGEFAKSKILDLILFFDKKASKDSSLENSINKWDWTEESSIQFIKIIGEPLIKSNLEDYWNEVYKKTK